MQKIPDVDDLLLRFLILISESSHWDKATFRSLLTTLSWFGFILPIFDSNNQSLSWCYEDISPKWATRAFVCFSVSNFTRIKQQQQRQISPNFRGKYLSHVLTLNLLLAACSLILSWHPGAELLLFILKKQTSEYEGSRQGSGAVCQLAVLFGLPAVSPCPATTFMLSACLVAEHKSQKMFTPQLRLLHFTP